MLYTIRSSTDDHKLQPYGHLPVRDIVETPDNHLTPSTTARLLGTSESLIRELINEN